MSQKSLVGKIKGAKKFAKSKDIPTSGVGKATEAISPGGKPRKKKK